MTWHGAPISYTDRDDWLAKRRDGIGASDVAGIVGLSPWSTPFTVWADKTQGVQKEQTESMHFGKVLEDAIVQEFQDRTGLYVGMRETLVRHPKFSWVMATIDGVAFESPDSDDPTAALGNVQVKTESGFGRWDTLPDHYEIQVQWEMLATGLTHTWVPVLFGGNRFEVYEVDADPGVQNRLVDLAADFRGKYVLGDEVPEVDEHQANTRVIADLWDEPDPDEVIELSRDMAADVEALRGWKKAKADAEGQIRRLENRIKVSMQDATVATVGGVPAVTWKTVDRKGYTVEAKRFRQFTLKKEKE